MDYETKKAELKEIRSKERAAREELQALINRESVIGAEVSQAYDKYIQYQAEQKAGQRDKKDVTKAKDEYQSLKAEQAAIGEKVEIAERVSDTLKEKVRQAERENKRYVVPHYKAKIDPRLSNIMDLMDDIQKEIDYLNSLQKDMQKDQCPQHVLQGITHFSTPMIRKTKHRGSIDMKNFITQFEL